MGRRGFMQWLFQGGRKNKERNVKTQDLPKKQGRGPPTKVTRAEGVPLLSREDETQRSSSANSSADVSFPSSRLVLVSEVEYARVVKPKDARTSFLESGAPPAATASQLEEQLYANVPFTCPPPEPLPLERIVEEGAPAEADQLDSSVDGPVPTTEIVTAPVHPHVDDREKATRSGEQSDPTSAPTLVTVSVQEDVAVPQPPAVQPTVSRYEYATPLNSMGYYFDGELAKGEGVLRRIETNEKFKFTTQHEYEELGSAVTFEVYRLMEEYMGLTTVAVPMDANPDREPTSFVFVTPNLLTALASGAKNVEKVLVLIHGSGAVRAGQWARSLIINENLKYGSMMPYILEGRKRGYEIVITNGNDSSEKRVRGNLSSTAHVCYVWEEVIRRIKPKKVAIVAHSAGGYNTVKLCDDYLDEFRKCVFAVALTDSAHGYVPGEVKQFLSEVGQNWVASNKPVGTPIFGSIQRRLPQVSAGHTRHEWTTCCAQDNVFAFIDNKERAWDAKFELYRPVVKPRATPQSSSEQLATDRKRPETGAVLSTSDTESGGEGQRAEKQKKRKKKKPNAD